MLAHILGGFNERLPAMENPADPMLVTETPLLLIPIKEAFAALGVSTQKGYQLVAKGQLPAFKLGGRAVVKTADLEGFIAGLPPIVAKEPTWAPLTPEARAAKLARRREKRRVEAAAKAEAREVMKARFRASVAAREAKAEAAPLAEPAPVAETAPTLTPREAAIARLKASIAGRNTVALQAANPTAG